MKSAILCPGPSLSQWDDDFEGLVLAVNRAALKFPCDAWIAGDYGLILNTREKVVGSPTLFTTASGDSQLRDHYGVWRGQTVTWESLHWFCPIEFQWEMFSFTAALVYAAHRGATQIDIYGADWNGQADWDGTLAGGNRSDDRWTLERNIATNRIFPWLAARGVEVRRCLPNRP